MIERTSIYNKLAGSGVGNPTDGLDITPELLRTRESNGQTIAHRMAIQANLRRINPVLVTAELLSLDDADGWTVAHAAAFSGCLDQVAPALITPKLLNLSSRGYGTVADVAKKEPHQLNRLLSSISEFRSEVQAAYRDALKDGLSEVTERS